MLLPMHYGTKKLSIYAKASLNIAEIQEKIRCGCDAVELNLEEDFLLHGNHFVEYYGEELFTIKDIEVIHIPSNQDKEMINLEWIFGHKDISILENVFSLAQYCSEIWNHRVIIVIHSCLAMYDFMQYELLQERILKELEVLFDQYPQVDIAIENAIPLEFGKAGKFVPRLCNGIYQDTSELVQWMCRYFGDRVGSVLDTCHVMMTERYLKLLLEMAEIESIFVQPILENINMEHYFQMNQGICKLIHLNNSCGNGYRENHGTSFETMAEVQTILNLYEKYKYHCPLTLEIREKNYLDCCNYRKTKKLIEEACIWRAQ